MSRETEILYRGAYVKGRAERPETPPIYLATSFNVDDLIADFNQALSVFD